MTQAGIPSFISCDWGTSRLRLCAVGHDLTVLAEYQSDQGIARTFEKWENDSHGHDRLTFYCEILARGISQLEEDLGYPLPDRPLICSGMASSTLGLKSLPYASLPFPLSGSKTIMTLLNPGSPLARPILLISGLQAAQDVMRGEETEIIGYHTLETNAPDSYIALLPGTHSKHLHIRNGLITNFQTYMTGEIFQLLQSHGTLRYSITAGSETPSRAFTQGVLTAREHPLLNTLFSVRANVLLEMLSPEDNYQYLSGLLIGSELRELMHTQEPLLLLANPALGSLYSVALRALEMETRLTVLPATLSRKAVFAGQQHLYHQYVNTP